MGYRSDIKAVFYTKHDDFAVLKLWLDENFPLKEFKDDIRWIDRPHCKGMMVELERVKWYDSYPDVRAFDKAAGKFIEMFCGELGTEHHFAYEFIRIGEDYNDVEVDRDGDFDYILEVEQKIISEV